MNVEIERIYSSGQEQANGTSSETADIVVYLKNGEKYLATFVTYDTIQLLQAKHQRTGDYLHGTYYWNKNLVLVTDCEQETVHQVVQHLLEEGEFPEVFEKM